MDKSKVIIITIQLAVSILTSFIIVCCAMWELNPESWGIGGRVAFILMTAAAMVGFIKISNNE